MAKAEKTIAEYQSNRRHVARVAGTKPTHPLSDYVGTYTHPAYGPWELLLDGEELVLRRRGFVQPLEHWHFDRWVGRETGKFGPGYPHPFDPTNLLRFDTNAAGQVSGLWIRWEQSLGPIRFEKQGTKQ